MQRKKENSTNCYSESTNVPSENEMTIYYFFVTFIICIAKFTIFIANSNTCITQFTIS